MAEAFLTPLAAVDLDCGGKLEVQQYIETAAGCHKPHADMVKLVITSSTGKVRVKRMKLEDFKIIQLAKTGVKQ
jgi:hypothetical protein